MDLEQSVETLLHEKQAVIRRFYEVFLAECSEARPYFQQVDLDRQATMLTMALMIVGAHCRDESQATQNYLRVLGDRHHDLGIPRSLFTTFESCLVRSIAEFHGNDWSPKLEQAWHDALQRAIATMLEGYHGSHPF